MAKYKLYATLEDLSGGSWNDQALITAANWKKAEQEAADWAIEWLSGGSVRPESAQAVSVHVQLIGNNGLRSIEIKGTYHQPRVSVWG